MIDDELRAKIRRLHYGEHWPIGTIASQLGVHHETVKRALGERGEPARMVVRPSSLDPYKSLIAQILEEYPKLRATRLHEMLRQRGYEGSDVTVRRYVRKVRPRPTREAFLRLSTLPGEQAQVDWGSFGKITLEQRLHSLSCFVMVLGHSRAMYACFFVDQQLESFLRGHVRAFERFAGTPREILYDNLRSVVLERVGDHIRFHPRLLELAGHYHFNPKPCAPYRANEKGKVERAIHYLRHSFFAARRYRDLDDLNAQLWTWLDHVADRRVLSSDPGRRRIVDLLEAERPMLLPLPEHPMTCERMLGTRVGKTPYVRFDQNDYSVPADYVGQRVTLLIAETTVRVVVGTEVVAEHRRSFGRGQTIEKPEHLAELHRAKRRAAQLRGRDRLRSACPNADSLIARMAVSGAVLGAEVGRLLRLLDQYGAAATDEAIAAALERRAHSAASVAYILDQRQRAAKRPPPLDVVLPDDARVRELHVTPHDLSAYDSLGRDDDNHQDQDP